MNVTYEVPRVHTHYTLSNTTPKNRLCNGLLYVIYNFNLSNLWFQTIYGFYQIMN